MYRYNDPANSNRGKLGLRQQGNGMGRETLTSGLSGTGRKVPCLPIWCSLQALGRDTIYNRILQSYRNVELVWKAMSKYTCIRIVVSKTNKPNQI